MAINLVRYEISGHRHWGVVRGDAIAPLDERYETTAAVIERGEVDWLAASRRTANVSFEDVKVLSPITTPARLLCQGANYRQHMIESGMNPDEKTFNMFFEKSDCSLNDPFGIVRRPAHVALLDYEIELALVFRKAITGPVTVTADNLADYVFGITIANDVSARDVQIPEMQFFKGKSYRGFCPMGPYLTVPDPGEFRYLDQLDLSLSVNGAQRQSDNTRNLVFKPAETITELSTFSDVAPGDVLLTGTPSGCALRVPPPLVRKLMQLVLPEKKLWAAFRKGQARRPHYLKPDDVITARISSADGAIELGEQRVTIAA
ncbi:fumarylacetoacetate hydrolase family protein [Sinorhizobium sp. NFACC03]|uniref:fumarylacetoacetate hydrolase family protein n=1 Tax=Sinorhizobium sp. NFACC03 TaxID=1566295 RepID=UPI000887C317|nr:fumarylacetoacetate hydrolase family protein [Sinorhizobium sp. NFACC03]SDA93808.1 2-keto-4-pentenoate hydratase/2-oxohepta-3-ene-1,7-dioic acid hydratase (catechol pathway) [Sinorhizobium sp. NFACC03]